MILKYDEEAERYNDLHCGACLKIKINDKYIEVRIELSGTCKRENWYFIDENGFTKKCYALEGSQIELD